MLLWICETVVLIKEDYFFTKGLLRPFILPILNLVKTQILRVEYYNIPLLLRSVSQTIEVCVFRALTQVGAFFMRRIIKSEVKNMKVTQEMYSTLFNGITDAKKLTEQAMDILIAAQKKAEELYIEKASDENNNE